MSNYQVDRARWSQMDILNQMGNIGSEVGRTISAKRRGDDERFNGALERALDLFDATSEALAAQRSPRLKEVLRSRDQFLSLFFLDKFDTDADNIERYFMQFATAARLRQSA
ncbi:MAG: hypothetical protein ABI220_04610 [Candidatus Saccharimonadales bacterium]